MLNKPYNWDMRPSNDILSQRPTHTTIEIIWIEPMLMVPKRPKSKLGPKTKITWKWGPKFRLICIDISCALHIDIFLQCKTLHYRIRKALIKMPKVIPTHNLINHYATLRKYKKHILCNTWWPMDVQITNIIGVTSGNDHTRMREINVVRPMWLVIHPWRKVSTLLGKTKHLFTL